MSNRKLLDYKRILIVDDEPDVLDTLEQLLPMCDVVKASSFDEAKGLLETQYFDIAILDIMGVDGYTLSEIARQREVIPVMLTAWRHSQILPKTYGCMFNPWKGVPYSSDQKCTLLPREVRFIARTFPLPFLKVVVSGLNFW